MTVGFLFLILFLIGTPCLLWAALETPPSLIQGLSLLDSTKKITWPAEPTTAQTQSQIQAAAISKNISPENKTTPAKDLLLSKEKLVVVFMSANCPCSHSHNQEVQQLANEFTDFNFLVVHSNPDESAEHAKSYFEQAGFKIPVLQDENLKWANAFHAKKTPHAFVITKNEVLYQGGVSSSNKFQNAEKKLLRQALNEIKNSKKVSEPLGRTLGCAISRDDED